MHRGRAGRHGQVYGPDSAIVVRDGAFVAERTGRFDDEFARGDEVAGLQVDR